MLHSVEELENQDAGRMGHGFIANGESVTLRFRYIQYIPLPGYSPPAQNDGSSYGVSIKTLTRQIEKVGSPGKIGLNKIVNGYGPWEEITLKTTPGEFVAIQFDLKAGNAPISDTRLEIQPFSKSEVKLVDFVAENFLVDPSYTPAPLNFLSVDSHTQGPLAGKTRVVGNYTVIGGYKDKLKDFGIEILDGNRVVWKGAPVSITGGLLQEMPAVGTLSGRVIFDIPIPQTHGNIKKSYSIRGYVGSDYSGGAVVSALHRRKVQALVHLGKRLPRVPRFGDLEDPEKGGDSWIRPDFVELATDFLFRFGLALNDISRMNGGQFKPHSTHMKGADLDVRDMAKYYLKNDAPEESTLTRASHSDSANFLISILSDSVIGGRVELIYVRPDLPQNGNFWSTINASSLSTEQKGLIRPVAVHDDYFHIRFK